MILFQTVTSQALNWMQCELERYPVNGGDSAVMAEAYRRVGKTLVGGDTWCRSHPTVKPGAEAFLRKVCGHGLDTVARAVGAVLSPAKNSIIQRCSEGSCFPSMRAFFRSESPGERTTLAKELPNVFEEEHRPQHPPFALRFALVVLHDITKFLRIVRRSPERDILTKQAPLVKRTLEIVLSLKQFVNTALKKTAEKAEQPLQDSFAHRRSCRLYRERKPIGSTVAHLKHHLRFQWLDTPSPSGDVFDKTPREFLHRHDEHKKIVVQRDVQTGDPDGRMRTVVRAGEILYSASRVHAIYGESCRSFRKIIPENLGLEVVPARATSGNRPPGYGFAGGNDVNLFQRTVRSQLTLRKSRPSIRSSSSSTGGGRGAPDAGPTPSRQLLRLLEEQAAAAGRPDAEQPDGTTRTPGAAPAPLLSAAEDNENGAGAKAAPFAKAGADAPPCHQSEGSCAPPRAALSEGGCAPPWAALLQRCLLEEEEEEEDLLPGRVNLHTDVGDIAENGDDLALTAVPLHDYVMLQAKVRSHTKPEERRALLQAADAAHRHPDPDVAERCFHHFDENYRGFYTDFSLDFAPFSQLIPVCSFQHPVSTVGALRMQASLIHRFAIDPELILLRHAKGSVLGVLESRSQEDLYRTAMLYSHCATV